MLICTNIYSPGKYFQFIPVRSCTKMPTFPMLCITGKLELLYCQNSITISEQDYSVADDTQEYFLLTKIYLI